MNKDEVKRRLEGLETISPPKGSLIRIQGLAADPDADIDQISRLIEKDPALTLQLLKLANSAYFGIRQSVDSVQRAVMVVGLKNVVDLVACISAAPVFQVPVPALDGRILWAHSCYVAEAARIVNRELRLNVEAPYMSGLLHDIGMMALASCVPEEYQKTLEYGSLEGVALIVAEREVLGLDHQWAGAALFERWGLPQGVVDAAASHHESGSTTASHLAELANSLAVREGADELAADNPRVSQQTLDVLRLEPEKLDELALAIHERREAMEVLHRQTWSYAGRKDDADD